MSTHHSGYITDHLFLDTISCPLKLKLNFQEKGKENVNYPFQRKNKLLLRDTLASRFPNVRYTSDETEQAYGETKAWLKKKNVSICGAVLRRDNLLTRIPILLKEEDQLTIVQIHGKLLKTDPADVFDGDENHKSINRYLLKAAYRYYVSEKVGVENSLKCRLIFPQQRFKAEIDQLFQRSYGRSDIDILTQEELERLFFSIDATSSVKKVKMSIPEGLAHQRFEGLSVPQAAHQIRKMAMQADEIEVPEAHLGCKSCRFRQGNKQRRGCWDIHFSKDHIQNQDRHIFELVGHHVPDENLSGKMYQEEIKQPESFDSAQKIIQHTDESISMYHRKALQLLSAKNRPLPYVYGKKLLFDVQNIKYPLHFLDFEAATHPVPMKKGQGSYEPVIFQFSCHTLFKDGTLTHSEWLDEEQTEYPHSSLIHALHGIPDIEDGTIIQFSPFERQACYQLLKQMHKKSQKEPSEVAILKKILHVGRKDENQRFFDLNQIIKNGYYNRYMNDGLTLKQILYSILQVQSALEPETSVCVQIYDLSFDLYKKREMGSTADPYNQIADERCQIRNGMAAMHAYINMKSGNLTQIETKLVPVLLRRYCALDSFALYVIYQHLLELIRPFSEPCDLLINEEKKLLKCE